MKMKRFTGYQGVAKHQVDESFGKSLGGFWWQGESTKGKAIHSIEVMSHPFYMNYFSYLTL